MLNKKTIHYPAWAEINLANIKSNFFQLKRQAGKGVKMLAAVKADAYGHGMLEVSRQLERCGVDYLGVASVNEAMVLRAGKIKAPILVMGNVVDKSQMKQAINAQISLTVADLRGALKLNNNVSAGKKAKVHIKVDTGMGRIGIWHQEAYEQIIKIFKMKNLLIEGVFTHFPSADTDLEFTKQQIIIFEKLINKLKQNNITISLVHGANSSAVFHLKNFKPKLFNMVRPGLMLYGMYPDRAMKAKSCFKLKPVLELKSRIVFLKTVDQGRAISYGRTYITQTKTKIATVSIGYADGYSRALSNKAQVLIKGKLLPVVGRICMDQLMVDIGLASRVKLGDIVTLIGREKRQAIFSETLATLCDTIPYEITCGISARVKRVFKKH
ncbi:MAG: alanine racemase [Candidatus Omnitrophica bacterium]|nr:alanine racemase [Candidatus Omnitrophota bacterium]